LNKKNPPKFDAADSASATLKGIKALAELCSEDGACLLWTPSIINIHMGAGGSPGSPQLLKVAERDISVISVRRFG
jgi:hypothetical protein